MATSSALSQMLTHARDAGCPREQVANFWRGLYIPLTWALEFHAWARRADDASMPDQIGVGGSRGPGKSHAIFAQVALDDCQRQPGINALYIRKAKGRAREQFDILRRKVLAGIDHEYKNNTIVFPNGSRLFIGGFWHEGDIDSYLGFGYDVIAIEENTTLSASKNQALRDSNRSSVPGWRPRTYNSTNPGGVGHGWYKRLFINPHRGGETSEIDNGTKFIPATVTDNPFIDAGYKSRLEDNVGWRLRAYRYGDWDIAAGLFFENFHADTHIIKPIFERVPSHWIVWGSLDYGFQHPTVAYIHAMNTHDKVVYTIAEHSHTKMFVDDHAQSIHRMAERWGVHVDMFDTFVAGHDVFATTRDGGETIAQKYLKNGIALQRANLDRINGAAEMLTRLGDPRGGVKPTWYIFDGCKQLARCLPELQHDPRRPEDVLKTDYSEDNDTIGDDPYDAARYGLMAGHVYKTIVTDNE